MYDRLIGHRRTAARLKADGVLRGAPLCRERDVVRDRRIEIETRFAVEPAFEGIPLARTERGRRDRSFLRDRERGDELIAVQESDRVADLAPERHEGDIARNGHFVEIPLRTVQIPAHERIPFARRCGRLFRRSEIFNLLRRNICSAVCIERNGICVLLPHCGQSKITCDLFCEVVRNFAVVPTEEGIPFFDGIGRFRHRIAIEISILRLHAVVIENNAVRLALPLRHKGDIARGHCISFEIPRRAVVVPTCKSITIGRRRLSRRFDRLPECHICTFRTRQSSAVCIECDGVGSCRNCCRYFDVACYREDDHSARYGIV